MCAQKEQSNSSWCPKALFGHLVCQCFTGKQKILWDSVFGAWGCASMIHSVSELQINTFRLLHGKISGSLLALFQKLRIETLFPEAVSYSPLPSEHHCILCSHHILGCPELMGYNPCGQGTKRMGVLSSSVGMSLWSWLCFSQQNKRLREEGRNSFVPYNARACKIPRQLHLEFLHTGAFSNS